MPPHLASPVPPAPARLYSRSTQMDTGFTPPEKYGPTGDAMTRYSASSDGRTPRNASEAYMNGRR
ncbi:Uncharacterised protein [Mycobacteroides abscessus]|nr:Uncharacterised protein [Mycobacteroides abscessus]